MREDPADLLLEYEVREHTFDFVQVHRGPDEHRGIHQALQRHARTVRGGQRRAEGLESRRVHALHEAPLHVGAELLDQEKGAVPHKGLHVPVEGGLEIAQVTAPKRPSDLRSSGETGGQASRKQGSYLT